MGTCFNPKYILYTHTGIKFTYPLINDDDIVIITWKEYDEARKTVSERFEMIYDDYVTRIYIDDCGLSFWYYGKDWNEFYDEYQRNVSFEEIDKQREFV